MFVFYTAYVILAIGRLSLADDPLVITEFSFEVYPKEDKILIACTNNKATGTILTKNDHIFLTSGQGFEDTLLKPDIAQYKCVPNSSKMVAILDLNTNIKELSHDIELISFVVDAQKKRASIEYKRKDNNYPLTCSRNNQEMIVESMAQGPKFVSGLDIENHFICELMGSKKFTFAFSLKDEKPKISDLHITVIPESRQVKILCQASNGLEPGQLKTTPVPQTINLYLANEVQVTSNETNQVAYFHDTDTRAVYKCGVENSYGKDRWNIEIIKIERKRLGDDGGILKFHLQPYSKVMKITSTFDVDLEFKCSIDGKEIDSIARQHREEEIKTFTKTQGIFDTYDCKAKNGDEIKVRVANSGY